MDVSRRRLLFGLGGCACCLAQPVGARVLPTRLEPLLGPDYQPADTDERGIWQSCERIEEVLQASNRRMQAPELQKYAQAVVERLLGRPAPELRIYLMHDASFNAAMFPNGMMLLHTGFLVRVRNEAQFAAVLGHEAGHYFRKHTLQQYRSIRRKSAVGTVFVMGAAGAAAGGAGALDHSWIEAAYGINLALMLSVFQFSRGMESEADAYGITLLARAGYQPAAAAELWQQLIAERRQSAREHRRRYNDRADSIVSTHPPSEDRMRDLTDTAGHLASPAEEGGFAGQSQWRAVITPHLPLLLEEQVKRNDPGASLYLIDSLARDGWTGLLHFQQGEIHRLRGAPGDAARAADAYAAAVKLPDAPAEAWRAHGYALLKSGQDPDARAALARYLELQPAAADAGMVRFTLAQ
jgi:Zn-dependent protease with chaperone function